MGILAEAYTKNPIENKFITPIDFSSIKDVPESHVWVEKTTSINHDKLKNVELNSIPVIDLNDPNAIDKIYHACKNWGFLQVTNHGISREILEKLETQVKKFFNLPHEEKMKVLRSPEAAVGYGSPRITPFFSKLMWCEGFTIMGNSLYDHAKVLWPNDDQGFCDVMKEYQTQMKALSEKLLNLILKSLEIPESEMNWVNQDTENISAALQLNSYPTCPNPTQTMGLAEHTDSFLFTILHQSGDTSGLQVLKEGLGWVSVDPVPGALVVNSGDLLNIISNGRFPSVVHRAMPNNEKHRISVAYFYGPPLGFQVSPYVGYFGCEGPCFKSLTVQEYVGIKSKLLESALSSIRIA
ncbi:gibberellin 3-beta-dioxygenase 1-like [Silene latifolia]|uniref:gibberellin 3-beta-dioxygenase 1-like n=1 Tax=Silene latifolia TaxID=37657 RepID=UPI003D77B49C